MPDKPLCPYCGPWNGHPDGVEMIAIKSPRFLPDNTRILGTFYKCPCCGARSPWEHMQDVAFASALRRFQPMQRPLTLEEARALEENPKWVEIREESDNCQSGWSIASCEYDYKFYYERFRTMGYLAIDKYGKTWRCCRTRPTDEERAAAKWEDG